MAPFVAQLNEGLDSLLKELHKESMAAAKVRFAIIGFNDTARCHLPPSDLRDVDSMPDLSAYNSTSFAAAFRELYSRIPTDVSQLKSEGYEVNRPAVFFLTDGVPNPGDNWEAPYAQLTSPEFRPHPNILAFGIGDAEAENIRKIASRREYAFMVAPNVQTGPALVEFAKALTRSVVSSGSAMAKGTELQVAKPKDFIALDMEPV